MNIRRFKNNNKISAISINQPVDYNNRFENDSKRILDKINRRNFKFLFISHASDGTGARLEEKDFVLGLRNKLVKRYNKVYLNLTDNLEFSTLKNSLAANNSKYGIFICSSRFVDIINDSKNFKSIYGDLAREIETFQDKEKQNGFAIIPVQYYISDALFGKTPFKKYKITLNDEKLNLKEKIELVYEKINLKINELNNI